MIKRFLSNNIVVVVTPLGKFEGVLLEVDNSKHGGFGSLILKKGRQLLLVRQWMAIAKK
jgi:hypothetical protein